MAAPASVTASELEPGFYWLRQKDECGWVWTVVRVYCRRKQFRVSFLATNVDKSLEQLEAADQTLGPEARMTSARSARTMTSASAVIA